MYPTHKITLRTVPDWLMHILAYLGGPIRQIINDIGNEKVFDGSKGEKLLGRGYISTRDSIRDTAESAFKLGLIRGNVA